jgi:eukaryotic-like serine/threonine-protein kinase
LYLRRYWLELLLENKLFYANICGRTKIPILIIFIILASVLSLEMLTSDLQFIKYSRQALAQEEESSNLLLYENSRFGVKMQYPPDWEKKEYNTSPAANNTIVEFSGPSKSVFNTPMLSIFIFPSNNTSLENAIDETIKDIENTNVSSSRVATLDNNTKAYMLNYTIETSHTVFQKMQIWTQNAGYIYAITYTETPDRYKTNLPTVFRMIDSFTLFDR